MKVAVLIDTWSPVVGGGQINAWEISKRLAKKGVEIDIVTRSCGRDKLKRVKNLNVYKLGSKSNPNDSLSKVFFVFRSFLFVYKRKYDLVHTHAFLPGITARLLMVFKGIPAIFTVHGTSINTKLNNVLSRQLEKFILTQILYSSQITVSQDFVALQNINKRKFYIPNGVEVKVFDRKRVQKYKNPTLIFVGRLHPQKNISSLITAITRVKEKIPNIRLLIIGDGEQKWGLQRQVKSLKINENIRFLGTITKTDLVNLYKASHIFILPSIYEGQPLTLLEAWAAKLPVIITKTGDCQYLVKDGKNGYSIHNSQDVREISDLIEKTLKNKNRDKMGENGYNFVRENVSWERSARETVKVYE